ncbi:AAA family ATPase [Streptomyces sp. NPDC048659]|uniref:AAA family ATPase n=1 Tax=Streptomyces sp. NPDC048659 TaxID=3155489 RepID=UPI003438A316
MAVDVDVEIRRDALRSTGLVGTVAIAEYGERGGLRDRRHVLRARSRFLALCDGLGFARAEALEGDGTLERVDEGLRRFVAADAERKILYWTGHGHATEEDGYVLACRGSYEPGRPHPVATRAMPFTRLLDRLSQVRGSELLVVIDACESQQTLDEADWLSAALRRYRRAGREAGGGPSRRVGRDGGGAARGDGAGATGRDGARPGAFARDGLVFLATAGADRPVAESLWVDWLQDTLADRSLELDGTVRPFEPTAPFLLVPDLLEAIDRRAVAAGYEDAALRPAYVEVHSLSRRFLHNPHYDSTDAVYRTAALPPDHEPWLTPAQFGPVNDGLLPGQFSGRVRPLSRLVTWTASQSRGMVVVTGPAGTGKTALLARLALLSVPRHVRALDPAPPPQTVPRPGSVHAAVSCHGQSLNSLSLTLLRALAPLGASALPDPLAPPGAPAPPGAEPPNESGVTARDAVERIGALVPRAGGVTLLVDGLDEAMPGQAHEIARRLLNPLSRRPGVKVVVGTRAHPRRTVDGGASESLVDALDSSSPVLDLDRDRDTERDIAALVAALLADTPGSPYAGPDQETARLEAAGLVARRCGRRFLVARLAARALARQPAPLPAAALDLFVQRGGGELRARMAEELDVLDPGDRDRCAELLLPLAVVQGPGLDDPELWLVLANTLRRRRTPEIPRVLLDTMLHRLKGVLITVEHRLGLPPLHRLDHAGYGPALLERARLTEGAAHRRVFEALHRPAGDWERAHPYALAYLGAHAAQVPAGADGQADGPPDEPHPLSQLFLDPEFLIRTDPDVLLPLTRHPAADGEGAALYQRLGPAFRAHQEHGPRRAVLAAEAFAGHRDLHEALDRLPGFAERAWREVWTDAVPRPAELTLPAPLGGALALDWSRSGLLSLAGRGEIVGRRADTGAYVHTRRAPGDPERDALFAAVRETSLRGRRITASHDGRSLHLWWGDERLPRRTYGWDGTVGALDAAVCGDGVQIVAADGHRVWAWRWAVASGGAGGAGDVRHDVLPVRADRVALLALRDRCFLLTASGTLTLHELHVKRYGDRPLVRARHEIPGGPGVRHLAAAALAEDAGHGLLAVAEAGEDRDAVTVWRVSAPGHGDPAIDRVARVESSARQIALGRRGALPLLALNEGGRVRVLRLPERAAGPASGAGVPVPAPVHAAERTDQPDPADPADRTHPPVLADPAARPDRPDPAAPACRPDPADRTGRADRPDPAYRTEAVLRLSAPGSGLAFDPAGSGRLAVGDGDEVRVVDTGAAAGPDPDPGSADGESWPQSGVAASPGGSVLLARATGARVLIGVHSALRGRTGPGLSFSRGSRVTAVAALWRDGAWLVAAAAGRRVRVWRLSEDLAEWAEEESFELAGDVNDVVPGLALVPAAGGGCLLFVPDGGRVLPYAREDGTWTARPAIVAADVKVCHLAAHTADGLTWVMADRGDSLALWEGTASGFDRVAVLAAAPDQRVGVALTSRDDGGVRVPLLTWAEAGALRLAEYDDGWTVRRCAAPHGPPTALAFAGAARRPLLLAFGGTGTVTVRDVAGNATLGELAVPHRGVEVRAAGAAYGSRHGLTLFVQGRDRCDQLRIPQDRLAAALGRG